jgi:hypothetical protein
MLCLTYQIACDSRTRRVCYAGTKIANLRHETLAIWRRFACIVRRDRNHPSVVVWSACNEVECVTAGGAVDTGKLMRAATKKWDTTRPFSANSWMNQKSNVDHLALFLDVEGFSHGGIGLPTAAQIHAENPGKAMVSSECCSCESQRGEDFPDATKGISYPHTTTQAECLQSCMNKSYSFWRGNPKPGIGVVLAKFVSIRTHYSILWLF